MPRGRFGRASVPSGSFRTGSDPLAGRLALEARRAKLRRSSAVSLKEPTFMFPLPFVETRLASQLHSVRRGRGGLSIESKPNQTKLKR